MNTIRPVPKWEIEQLGLKPQGGRPMQPEMKAVKELVPGKAIAFDCTWEHRSVANGIRKSDGTPQKHNLCPGTNRAYVTARRAGFRIHATCRDKTVYVQRRVEQSERDNILALSTSL